MKKSKCATFWVFAYCARFKNQCAREGQNAPLSRKITTSGHTACDETTPRTSAVADNVFVGIEAKQDRARNYLTRYFKWFGLSLVSSSPRTQDVDSFCDTMTIMVKLVHFVASNSVDILFWILPSPSPPILLLRLSSFFPLSRLCGDVASIPTATRLRPAWRDLKGRNLVIFLPF